MPFLLLQELFVNISAGSKQQASSNVQMESKIEDSLSMAVKQAVLELFRALVGDKNAEVSALFHVTLVVEKNQRLELKPTVQVGLPHERPFLFQLMTH